MTTPGRFRACTPILLSLIFLSPAVAKYSGGSGTADDPYRIATAADLIALGETPEDHDKHFILTADIDLDPNLPDDKVFDRAVIAPSWATPFTRLFVHTYPGQHSLAMPVCHKTSDTGLATESVTDGGVPASCDCDPLVHTATVRRDQLFS